MPQAQPERTRVYQNHLLDSTRWDRVRLRAGDVVVATPYKCGTTWMQNIVLHLIFQDLVPRHIDEVSPWVDQRVNPLDEMLETLEGQTHRRCLKSHLPLDGIRFEPEVKYIVVGRDPRDVFMSLWNHYRAYTDAAYRKFNGGPARVGPPMPRCPEDIRTFWAWWIGRGWFAWEREGYPHWSNFAHVESWWRYRHLPNIEMVHYNDLLADLEGGVARIAAYLGIDCAPQTRVAIADVTSFGAMKRDAERIDPVAHKVFEGGAKTFINKGTNGRWREVLTAADLEMYEATAARELSPGCRAWLENGG